MFCNILGTRFSILRTLIGSLEYLKKPALARQFLEVYEVVIAAYHVYFHKMQLEI